MKLSSIGIIFLGSIFCLNSMKEQPINQQKNKAIQRVQLQTDNQKNNYKCLEKHPTVARTPSTASPTQASPQRGRTNK